MTDLSRRRVLSTAASVLGGVVLAPNLRLEALELPDSGGQPDDEAFWRRIRSAFDLPAGITNLDNGASGSPPRGVMDDLLRYTRYVEELPATRLLEVFRGTTRKVVIPRIATLLGVGPDEIALVRNATEAMDTVILGLPLSAGDEVVCSAHDYWAMLDALEQRRARDGIVIKMIRPPVPAASQTDLAQLYEAAITTRTRLVLVTHASNVTGQLYPVKQIAAAAHKVGAEVALDAAQTMALFPHTIADLDCDYYGASMHKWLLAPVGSGVLWMRKAHVNKVWPLIPPGDAVGMHRFMACGTYPEPIEAAIARAIDLHEMIGATRKADRLRHLTRYWRRKAAVLPGTRFYTTEAPENSCGLAVLEIAGVDSEKLQTHLWEKHRIVVQRMQQKGRAPEINGIRVTPSIYTLLVDLDRLVNALQRVVERGL